MHFYIVYFLFIKKKFETRTKVLFKPPQIFFFFFFFKDIYVIYFYIY